MMEITGIGTQHLIEFEGFVYLPELIEFLTWHQHLIETHELVIQPRLDLEHAYPLLRLYGIL